MIKKIVPTILFLLVCVSASVPASTIIYTPPEALYYDANGTTPVNYYDLIATGPNEPWDDFLFEDITNKTSLQLLGIAKYNTDGEHEINVGNLNNYFTFNPGLNELTDDTKTGSWLYSHENNPLSLSQNGKNLYFSIKAGNGYNLFKMNADWYGADPTMSPWVSWSTGAMYIQDESGFTQIGLNDKGLSHIAFWTLDSGIPIIPPEEPPAVPEPATLLLLGFGLLVLAGLGRKTI